MKQLFFVSPQGRQPIRKAFGVDRDIHPFWCDGTDPDKDQIVGCVEMNDHTDAEVVISKLEAQGVVWLPNHFTSQAIPSVAAVALAKHGVLPTDTTAQAMEKIWMKNPHVTLKPKRF
jgi:hypothetical protein